MKKTILRMALFAIVAGVVVSACSKDDVNAVKDTPSVATQTSNSWPEGALQGGDDTYRYIFDERIELNRIDSMLCVFYHPDSLPLNNLPGGYCPVLPGHYHISRTDSLKGMFLLFENRNRSTAIEELKRIDGIVAIEPVYRTESGSLEVYGPGFSVQHFPGHYEECRMIDNIANSLGYSLQDTLDTYRRYSGNHSLVSSVAACNMVYESRVLDSLFLSPILFSMDEYK